MQDLSTLVKDGTHTPAVEAWSLNHWTPGKSLEIFFRWLYKKVRNNHLSGPCRSLDLSHSICLGRMLMVRLNSLNTMVQMKKACCCCCQVASVVSDCVQPHRWQPNRLLRPWDSPGKNTGVGCHCLLRKKAYTSSNIIFSILLSSS